MLKGKQGRARATSRPSTLRPTSTLVPATQQEEQQLSHGSVNAIRRIICEEIALALAEGATPQATSTTDSPTGPQPGPAQTQPEPSQTQPGPSQAQPGPTQTLPGKYNTVTVLCWSSGALSRRLPCALIARALIPRVK